MPDIQAMLSKKVGPLPMWGWLAGGGGLVGFLYMQRKGASANAAGQPGATPDVPYVPSPIIVTPQTAPPSVSSINSPTPTTAADTPIKLEQWQRIGPGFKYNGAGNFIKGGQQYIWMSDPNQAGAALSAGNQLYFFVAPGVPLPTTAQSSGAAYYIATPAGSGMGGGPANPSSLTLVPRSGGGKLGRFSGKHAHSQYLTTGMGGGGHAALQQTSQRTGVPVGRLMALNPDHWQHPHRQKRANVIHIA